MSLYFCNIIFPTVGVLLSTPVYHQNFAADIFIGFSFGNDNGAEADDISDSVDCESDSVDCEGISFDVKAKITS